MDPIQLHLAAKTLTASPSARTITGTIAVYNKFSTSQGINLQPGCLTPRQPLNRVKMLRDHNMSDAVGYMTDYDADTLSCTFAIPDGPDGDEALTKAANGLRDGLSIGFQITAYHWDEDYNLIVEAAELYEVSLCAIPDFQDAQIESVALSAARKKENIMTPEEIAAMQAENSRLQQQLAAGAAPVPASPAAPEAVAPVALAAAALPAAPVALAADQFPQAGSFHTAPRPRSLREVSLQVSQAVATGDQAQIRLALSDVLPADDAGHGFLGRPGWIGEVWQAAKSGRPWIESLGTPGELTSMKLEGWAWETRPKPQKYAGNKTPVPSNKPKTKPITADAERWAGGWDIDRIFIDLGSAEFLQSFWTAAAAEYDADSDSDIAAKMIAAATYKGASGSAVGAIGAIAADLRKVGARANQIWLAEDVFDEYANLTQDAVPFWLANATGVSLAEAKATISDLSIEADESLEPGNVIGYDRRAAEVKEKRPIQLQAFDIAKGGIDLGFFSYGGLLVNDPRAIVLRTVGDAPAPAAPVIP